MDDERLWERIVEAVRFLAEAYDVEIPAELLVASGSAWAREEQRRAALNAFLEEIPDLEPFDLNDSLEAMADRLDQAALELKELDEEPDGSEV